MSLIIAISGASGSGKTTFANDLKQTLEKEFSVLLISQDDYYCDQSHLTLAQRELTNYDIPEAFDQALLQQHIKALSEQQSVEAPVYCFETHTRKPQPKVIQPSQVILLEGLMLFNQAELRSLFDVGVFIDTPHDICLLRRLGRDMKERGRSFESIRDQYMEKVRPMYVEHIAPSKSAADIVWSDYENTQTLLQNVTEQVKQNLR